DQQREAAVERRELRYVAELPPPRRQVVDDPPRPGGEEAEDELQERRLAAAVGTEDRQVVARQDPEAHPVEDHLGAVAEGHLAHFEDRGLRGLRLLRLLRL